MYQIGKQRLIVQIRKLLKGYFALMVCALMTLPSVAAVYDLDGNLLDSRDLVPGADFSGVNWVNPDFRGLDLNHVDFSNAIFTGADFDGANLEFANFLFAEINQSNFQNANVNGINLSVSRISHSQFQNLDFGASGRPGGTFFDNHGDYLAGMFIIESDFSGSDLSNRNFGSNNIEHSKFIGTDFSGSSLAQTDMNYSDARFANFQNIWWDEEDAGGNDFRWADFRNIQIASAIQDTMIFDPDNSDPRTNDLRGAFTDQISFGNAAFASDLGMRYVELPEPSSLMVMLGVMGIAVRRQRV